MGSDRKKIAHGISFSWVKFGVAIIIGLAQTPLLFKYLNATEINYWYVFFSFGAFLQMADLGLASAISRYVAYIQNAGNFKGDRTMSFLSKFSFRQIYFTTLISFFLCLLLLLSVIIFIFVIYVDLDSNRTLIIWSFAIFGVGIVMNLLSNIPHSFLTGLGDVGYDNLVKTITQIVYFIILYSFLPYYSNILFVAFAFTLQILLQFLSMHILLFIKHEKLFIKGEGQTQIIVPKVAMCVYQNSWPMFVNQLGSWLTNQSTILLISVIVGTNLIANFALQQQLFGYGLSIVLIINQAIGPLVAKKFIKDQRTELKSFFETAMIVCLVLIGIFEVIMLTCSDRIIDLWVGKNHFIGYNVVLFLAISSFLEVQHSIAANFTWNMGKWPFNVWTLVCGILNLLLGYVFGKLYGITGIVAALCIAKILTINWYAVFFALRELDFSIYKYLLKVFIPIISIFILFTVAFKHLMPHINPLNDSSWLRLLIVTSSISIIILGVFATIYRKGLSQNFLKHK